MPPAVRRRALQHPRPAGTAQVYALTAFWSIPPRGPNVAQDQLGRLWVPLRTTPEFCGEKSLPFCQGSRRQKTARREIASADEIGAGKRIY